MTSCRAVALAGILAVAFVGSAAAQVPLMRGNLPDFDTAPPAPPPGAAPAGPMMGAPPPGAPPPGAPGAAQEPPCFRDFRPLRDAAEKRAGMIKAATENKMPERQALCQLFKNFAVAEAKVVKYVTDNQAACQIPPEAITQMRANHERTVKTRDNICSGAAAPGAPPPGPRLSDELGVRGVAGPNTITPGRGTFDTLMGSPLSR